jgi:hypothetical protein
MVKSVIYLLFSHHKFTGPNKNKNNFTCLLLYQLAANCLFSHKKYQTFPAVVAFNQGLLIFHFSMKYDVTHILTPLKKECQRYGKGHVKIRKMERKKKTQIYLLQLDPVFKKIQWMASIYV